MKFTVSQKDLNAAMQFVSTVIDGKSTMPVLNNVLIDASDGKLTLCGSNLEIEKRISIDADVSEDGKITVPAKKLSDFAKNADSSKNISLSLKETKATISSGKSKWTLTTIPSSSYPDFMSINNARSINVDSGDIIKAISRCSNTLPDPNKEVRHYLCGMLFDVSNDGLTLVATDGHRMSCNTVECSPGFEQQAIIPNKAINDISKMLAKTSDVSIELSVSNVKVSADNMVMYAKLIEGTFPTYERVIPNNFSAMVSINSEEFRSAIKRTLPLANKHKSLLFSFENNSLTITATNEQHETATEEIPVSIEGESLQVGFNGQYVMDMLNSVEGENIMFQAGESKGASKVVEDNFISVLMPFRV